MFEDLLGIAHLCPFWYMTASTEQPSLPTEVVQLEKVAVTTVPRTTAWCQRKITACSLSQAPARKYTCEVCGEPMSTTGHMANSTAQNLQGKYQKKSGWHKASLSSFPLSLSCPPPPPPPPLTLKFPFYGCICCPLSHRQGVCVSACTCTHSSTALGFKAHVALRT